MSSVTQFLSTRRGRPTQDTESVAGVSIRRRSLAAAVVLVLAFVAMVLAPVAIAKDLHGGGL